MRTQALRVSIGAYSDGTWHVAQIIDHYERGVLINSSIETLAHPTTLYELRELVDRAIDRILKLEGDRIELERAAG